MKYAHIAARVFNTPLLVDAGKLQIILGVLGPRMGIQPPDLGALIQPGQVRRATSYGGKDVEGIRTIQVDGTLVNRYATADSGVDSYDAIGDDLAIAVADPEVRAIMLRIDSYGGEVGGLWDLADAIRQAKQVKPVWASVDDSAFSAAFAIASQADRIYVTRTAGVGSVGVIAVHFDYSKFMENEGIKATPIFAGARKADFSMMAPLGDEAFSFLRGSVDREYERFLEYVAVGRGMEIDAVRATEAGIYEGEDGIKAGFADVLGTYAQALNDLADSLATRVSVSTGAVAAAGSQPPKEATMANPIPEPAATETVDRHSITMAERKRVQSILSHPEAEGREQLARHLALETDLSLEAAAGMLAAAPKATKPATNPLAAAMQGVQNPAPGVAGAGGEQSDAAMIAAMTNYGNNVAGVERN